MTPADRAVATGTADVPRPARVAAEPPPLPLDASPPPGPVATRLQFTGEGAEYFRIWVANLLLTIATLGIYSAWAKARRTRYFWQNTRLDGHVFDYHGRPLAILRGRVLALVLLAAYTWGGEISLTAGAIAVLGILLAGPWLFLRANQFRMRNTSWRGLRFDFSADARTAYRSLMPILLIWFSGTLASLLTPDVGMVFGIVGAITPFLVPWMHHRLKQFQHGHAAYGDAAAVFRPVTRRFYGIYLRGALLAVLVAIPAGLIGAGLGYGIAWGIRTAGLGDDRNALALAMGAGTLVVMYIGLWPYYATRVQQAVWGASTLGPVSFHTHVQAWPLAAIALRAALLTVVTLGLYWPFAAVALARYRIECMEVTADSPFDAIAANVRAPGTTAAGDGAADVFGLDIGL